MEFKIDNEKDDIRVSLIDDGKIKAKAICYYKNTPKEEGKNIGCIGEFEAENDIYGVEILNKCEGILKEKNVNLIVAPMNGNTWKKYRTMKWSNGDNLFLLENVNSIEYNEMLKKAGFEELYTYTSTKGKIENAYHSKAIDRASERLEENNIQIRKFDKSKYEEDLKKIYNISKVSFYRNPFYTPIEENDFLKQYLQYLDLLDEDFIWIAEQGGREVAFIFAVPNYNELKEGKKLQTVILKTVAVIPEYEHFAIGHVLLEKVIQSAKSKNFTQWIFAFMYEQNTSQKSAKKNKTEIIREYAIYGKHL